MTTSNKLILCFKMIKIQQNNKMTAIKLELLNRYYLQIIKIKMISKMNNKFIKLI